MATWASLGILLLTIHKSVAFQSTHKFRHNELSSGKMASPLTGDAKKRLIWRYLKDCLGRMDHGLIYDIFHPDAVFNTPSGDKLGFYDISKLIQDDIWPLIKPGTLKVDVDYYPHEWWAIPLSGKKFPAEELQRFKATLTGERVVPDENGSRDITLTLFNIWRIVDGQCRETWPAYEKHSMAADPIATSRPPFSNGIFYREATSQQAQKEWTPAENDLLKDYNDILKNVVSPQRSSESFESIKRTSQKPKTHSDPRTGISSKQPSRQQSSSLGASPDPFRVGLEHSPMDMDATMNGLGESDRMNQNGVSSDSILSSDSIHTDSQYYSHSKNLVTNDITEEDVLGKRDYNADAGMNQNSMQGNHPPMDDIYGAKTPEAFFAKKVSKTVSEEAQTSSTTDVSDPHYSIQNTSGRKTRKACRKTTVSDLLDKISSNDSDRTLYALMQLGTEVLDADEDGAVRSTIFLACGHLAITNAMKKYRVLRDIQYWGCVFLNRIAYTEEHWSLNVIGGGDGLRIGLATVGALDATLQAMEEFPHDVTLNQEAIKALFNIIYCKDNFSLSLELGVTDAVVSAMRLHFDNEAVQSLGCRLLWYVCRAHPEGRSALQESKALGTIAAVIDNFDENSEAYVLAYQTMTTFLSTELQSTSNLS